jgi:hypothetical protein
MNTPTATLDGWTADELFVEVLSRSAGDRSALNLIQAKVIRALLDYCDQSGAGTEHWHAVETPLSERSEDTTRRFPRAN